MTDPMIRVILACSSMVTLGSMASLAERLVITDSFLQPMDIVYKGEKLPFFYPWPAYLILGTILSVLYYRFGRR